MLNQKGIKGALKGLIGQVALDKAIYCLKNLATTETEYDQVLSFDARYNSWKKRKFGGVMSTENEAIEERNLVVLLLEYLKDLPDSQDLLKKKLVYLVRVKEEIPSALDFLEELIHPHDYSYLKVHELRSYQEKYEAQLATEDIDTEDAEERDQLQEDTRKGLLEFIDAMEPHQLKEDWGDLFLTLLLEEKVEPIVSYRERKIIVGESSRYLNEIRKDTKDNEDARRTLLLWQEEYLSGDFPKAEEY